MARDKDGNVYLTIEEQKAKRAKDEARAAKAAQAAKILGLATGSATSQAPPEADPPAPQSTAAPQTSAGAALFAAELDSVKVTKAAPRALQDAGKVPPPPEGAATPPASPQDAKRDLDPTPDYAPRLSFPPVTTLEPGNLNAGEPATDLTPAELRLVAHMVKGKSWNQALDLEGYPPRSSLRDNAPRDAIKSECERSLRLFASECAASASWIISECVALYRRAAQAEPVLDRKGNPTGVYRFDGPTARACLEMLGKQQGMFKDKGAGIAVSDVADLLAAVAQRGRPALPGDRARLVGSGSTSIEETPK